MGEYSKDMYVHYARKYFYYIGIENILDMILTLLGTSNGYGVEINPFLSEFIHNPFVFILIKGIFPTLLLLFVFIRLKQGSLSEIKKSILFLKICFYWYVLVISSHSIWIFYSLTISF